MAVLLAAATPIGCVLVSTNRSDAGRDRDGGEQADARAVPEDASGTHRAERARAVLASIGANVILPRLRAFEDAAGSLLHAAETYATTLAADDRAAAQRAWREAIGIWQELEVLQVGPAGKMPRPGVMGTYGGRDLRDPIYSWPLVNTCRIDQETVSQDYEDPDAFEATELVNVRGLDALEYLLFVEGDGNTCSASSTINASGQWTALGSEEIRRRRARYARSLAILLHRNASELLRAWEQASAELPEGGDFLAQLSNAGLPGSVYPTAQEGLNAVVDAFLYIDVETKDRKLAAWIGMGGDCMRPACPELLESRFAGINRENLIANLRGFRAAFLGADVGRDAMGFDDLLVSAGAGDLRDRLLGAIDRAMAAFEALPAITPATLAANVEAVNQARVALKAVTDLLKTEFLTVLDIELPMGRDGDND
jgi:predicted lipoprotein